jgi:ABC-2 type transport system permease protein
VIVSVYALTLLGQVSFWNSVGFDRSAVGFYYAAPPPFSKVLLGKNLAALFFVYAEVLIVAVVTAFLKLTRGWTDVVSSLVATGVCALYLLAVGNINSVRFPKAMSPERVSQGGSTKGFNGLMFILYPLALIPVGLAYLAGYAFNSQIAFAAVLAIAAGVGVTVYWFSMESAVRTAHQKRESILQELSKGDGPVLAG